MPGGPAGGHRVVIGPEEVVEGVNFGNQPIEPAPGSIHGLKWLDRNGNGEQDPGERGLPGVTIYVDLNHNGVLDVEEPHTVTMEEIPETDFEEGGRYWLEGLAPGHYTVREVVPDGFVQTFPQNGLDPAAADRYVCPNHSAMEDAHLVFL